MRILISVFDDDKNGNECKAEKLFDAYTLDRTHPEIDILGMEVENLKGQVRAAILMRNKEVL